MRSWLAGCLIALSKTKDLNEIYGVYGKIASKLMAQTKYGDNCAFAKSILLL